MATGQGERKLWIQTGIKIPLIAFVLSLSWELNKVSSLKVEVSIFVLSPLSVELGISTKK